MIKVLYSPQMHEYEKIEYNFEGEKVTATYQEVKDEFDFTGLPDGRAEEITTILPIQPIHEAYREDGVLHVVLLNYIPFDASEEEKFPKWKEV